VLEEKLHLSATVMKQV